MSAISAWVLSIAGIIVLSVLVDMVLPSGSTAKFIKNIFGYVIIIVIISPIFSFFSDKNYSINEIFNGKEIVIQQEYISKVNQQVINSIKSSLEKEIFEIGFKFVEIGIKADIFSSTLNIEQISVDLTNLVIDENSSHINIKTSIIDIIQKSVNINKECIVFYE